MNILVHKNTACSQPVKETGLLYAELHQCGSLCFISQPQNLNERVNFNC